MPAHPTYENIKKCRLLRANGYSDDELLAEGFDSATISRAFTAVSERNAVKVRCKECGRLFFRVNRAGHCLACEHEQKTDIYALVKSSVIKPVTHPDIVS